jgi:methylenetetrahydrofolate reductase (NADPH)
VPELYHQYASELQIQVNNFNKGVDLDGDPFQPPQTVFSYGMACYPEKHAEANSIEEDIKYAKLKVDNGAQYLVTQMFFDNQKYFQFVQQLRSEGIHVPVIPGIKPIVFMNQLDVLPKVFQCSIPEPLASELKKCKNDVQAAQVGIEWGIQQCRELIKFGVPSLHFYTFMAVDSVKKIAQEIY